MHQRSCLICGVEDENEGLKWSTRKSPGSERVYLCPNCSTGWENVQPVEEVEPRHPWLLQRRNVEDNDWITTGEFQFKHIAESFLPPPAPVYRVVEREKA